MTVALYASVEIISILLFYLGDHYSNIKIFSRILAFIIMFVLIGFRDTTVGIDYQNYYNVILNVAGGQPPAYFKNWLSVGFTGLIKLENIFGIPESTLPIVVIATVGFLTLLFYYRAFDELSDSPTTSLYLLFCSCLYFQMMNQFRQMLAVAIILYSYKYMNKSFIKYAALVLLAASIHKSAIIMLPIFFLVKLKLSKKVLFIYILVAISMTIFYPFMRSLIQYTSYSGYLGWEKYDIGTTNNSFLNFIVRFVLLFSCLPFMKKLIKLNSSNRSLYHLAIICTITQVLVLNVNLFSRITTYFFVFYLLLIPKVLKQIRVKFVPNSRPFVNISFATVFLVYQIVYYVSQSSVMGYNVYHFLSF